MNKSNLVIIAAFFALSACTQKDNGVKVSSQKPVTKVAAPRPVARSEPIFYNGKTYQFKLAPQGNGQFDLAVNGMSDAQQKDAVAVATSSLRYFACPDGKTGKLINSPTYVDNSWKMTARCG
jgi:hypothetical protein